MDVTNLEQPLKGEFQKSARIKDFGLWNTFLFKIELFFDYLISSSSILFIFF